MSGNGFTDHFHNLRNLQYKVVDFLNDQILELLFTVPKMAFVYLYNNSLNGSFPGNVGSLSELVLFLNSKLYVCN